MRTRTGTTLFIAALVGGASCAVEPASPTGSTSSTSTSTSGGTAGGPNACEAGAIPGPDGACLPVGIQGCAAIFVEGDGVCRPSVEKCPAGQIPDASKGCVPVGIQGCAPIFLGEDGLCRPSIERCPAGQIPDASQGCVPVGIQGCAAVFMEDDGVCHPRMSKCAPGSFAVPQQGCVPIDGPDGCGDAPWGAIPDAPGTVYVDQAYAGGGNDGSRDKPFLTLAEALLAATPGSRIALAEGNYAEAARVKSGLEIAGRCASKVTLSGVLVVDGGLPATVWIDHAQGASVKNLTLAGAGIGVIADSGSVLVDGVHFAGVAVNGAVSTGAGADLTIQRSFIEGTLPDAGDNRGNALRVVGGGQLTVSHSALFHNRISGIIAGSAGVVVKATDVLIEGTLSRASDKQFGFGMQLDLDAHASFEGCALVENRSVAVLVNNGAALAVTGSLIEGTLPRESDQNFGEAVQLNGGSKAELTGNALLDNHRRAVFANGEGVTLTATANLIRGTLPRPSDEAYGTGIEVLEGAKATLRRNALIENHAAGLFVGGAGSTASSEGDLFEGTLAQESDHDTGYGIIVTGGAVMSAHGSALLGNHTVGVLVGDPGSELDAVEILVADTRSRPNDERFGNGAVIQDGGKLTLERSAIVDNRSVALLAIGADATLVATDTLVADTLPQQSDLHMGHGVDVVLGARGTFHGGALLRNHEVGFALDGVGSAATLAGLVIEGTLPSVKTKQAGRGLVAQEGATLDLLSVALIRNHQLGLSTFGEGTLVTASACLISRTLPLIDAGDFGPYGGGVLASNASIVTISASILEDSRVAALMVDGATATLVSSWIDRVAASDFHTEDGHDYSSVGDGILARGATVTSIGNTITRCDRAGLLFDDSAGASEHTHSTRNRFGLVLQGKKRPTVAASSRFDENEDQDVVSDGDLPVPNAPSELPGSSQKP